MKNYKLVFVTNKLSFFFSHRLLLAKAAQQAGYQVHVVGPDSGDSEPDQLIQQGFYFHSIPLDRKGINPFSELKSIYSLFRLYRSLKPQIVHHLTIKPILYGGIAARLARVPAMINAVTGLGYLFISQKFFAKFLRFFVKKGFRFSFRHPNMRVIFQNSDDRNQFVQDRLIKRENGLLIKGSGVPLDEYRPLPNPDDAEIVVLLPSRLLWDKGIAEFVQAADILRQHYTIRMVLAGEIDPGNPASISKKQLDTWVSQGFIEYWGFQKNIQEAFARAHIICLPSYREGTPRVLIEAAACARPIVTTDVPGCRDIVIHGENGLLVEAKNAQALAEGIAQLIKNPELRTRMGERGRKIVEENFSSCQVNRETLAVYNILLTTIDCKTCRVD